MRKITFRAKVEGGNEMARYLGPTYKKSRRFGFSVLENGKELAKKPYAPGEHGQDRRKKLSNYGVQLQEKQKVKFMYGLSEKQMEKTFEKAVKMKGVNGENLLKLLESRLDKHKEMFSNQQNLIEELKKSMYHAFNQKLINASHYREDKHKEMIHAIELYHMVVKKHLKENESLLDAYSPLKVLTRGYSITNNNEHVIRSVNEVNEGDMIFTRLSDGTITSKIIKKEKQNG